MLQSPLLQFPSFGIHKSNLLKAGMIITPYNNHVGSLLPGLGWLAPPKSIRVREPTLLWNQLRSLTFPTSPCSMPLHGFQGGELSPRELQERYQAALSRIAGAKISGTAKKHMPIVPREPATTEKQSIQDAANALSALWKIDRP